MIAFACIVLCRKSKILTLCAVLWITCCSAVEPLLCMLALCLTQLNLDLIWAQSGLNLRRISEESGLHLGLVCG